MALPAEVGDRLHTNLANCNFMVGCESCWFDDEQVDPIGPTKGESTEKIKTTAVRL